MNREQRRAAGRPKRAKAITGLAFLAAASAVTSYGQILRAPGAYAAATTCSVNSNADSAGDANTRTLRYCMTTVQANSGGGTITFDGVTQITLTSALPFVVEDTTIDGGAGVTIDGGAFGFLKVNADDKALTLDSLTISGFSGTGGSDGVVYSFNKGGTLDIIDSTISGNSTTYSVYVEGKYPTVTVTNSTFSNNYIDNEGAAIDANGTLTVTSSTFTANNSQDNTGGAIYAGGELTVTDSVFTGNRANEAGGAIYQIDTGSDVTITRTTFTDNEADADNGGAVYVYEADDISIVDSTFTGNKANYGGGLYVESTPTSLTISGSRFSGNTALYDGGAIYAAVDDPLELAITKSTIVNNVATDKAGGILVDGTATTTLTNTYVGGNVAQEGGAIIAQGNKYAWGTLALNFSTLAGNSSDVAPNVVVTGDLTNNGSVLSSAQTLCEVTETVADKHAVATDASCGFTDATSRQSVTSGELGWSPDSKTINGVEQTSLLPSATSILVTGAPTGGLGTGITDDQFGVVRADKFTIGSRQYVAPSPTPPPTTTASPTTPATPTASPSPTPKPSPSARKAQKPRSSKGKPPASVKSQGITVITGRNARTNAGQLIRTRVRCTPTKATAAGDVRDCAVIRGSKGKVSLRTFGHALRVVVVQRAPQTKGYKAYRKVTKYRIPASK